MSRLRQSQALGNRFLAIDHSYAPAKPVQGDESVVSVESVFRTKIDRDQSSVERSNLRKILERKAEIAIQGEKKLEEDSLMLKLILRAEIGNEENPNSLYRSLVSNLNLKRRHYFKRDNVLIRLKEKGLICVKSWK